MAKTTAQPLYKVECDPECGFLVRNHNEVELVSLVITHCVNTHNKSPSDKEVRGWVKRD